MQNMYSLLDYKVVGISGVFNTIEFHFATQFDNKLKSSTTKSMYRKQCLNADYISADLFLRAELFLICEMHVV